jgi:deoxyribonuclease-1
MKNICLSLLMLVSGIAMAEPQYPATFEQAKRESREIFSDHRIDQYCGCKYDGHNRVDLASCGYVTRKNEMRAKRIEAEHVTPAENIGRQYACWREGKGTPGGGREYCMDHDPEFVKAHNDLHNLLPVIGEVNADRSNFRYDAIAGPATQYGQCQFKVDFDTRRAEPPDNLKGDISRISLYMRDQHGVKFSPQQIRLFEIWSRQDPVDAWERTLDQRIAAVQGNSNPYVSGAQVTPGTLPTVLEATTPVKPLPMARPDPVVKPALAGSSFSCEQHKSCKMMSSCAEAKFQLTECGNARLDGDGDGVPCNALCR